MSRRLLTFLTVFSLVLCASACVLWGWSYFNAVSLYRKDGGVYRSVLSDSGMLAYSRHDRLPGVNFPWRLARNRPGGWGGTHLRPELSGHSRFDSVATAYPITPQGGGPPTTVKVRQTWVPWWSVCAALALLPGYRLVRRAAAKALDTLDRRVAARRGLCPACGYDLRATPDQCPECGAVPSVSRTG